jgi:spermidine synthase
MDSGGERWLFTWEETAQVMTRLLEELDHRVTPMGILSLRRRRILALDIDVLEVMLGEEHLMSSLFTEGEKALATLALEMAGGEALEVLVGGLGLGYTAAAALDDPRVSSVVVAEALEGVIDWHRQGLVPLGPRLFADPRFAALHTDFFAEVAATAHDAAPRFDLILLDIDHSPDALLSPRHAAFYCAEGLAGLSAHLRPGGVFAMWSDAAPDPAFQAILAEVFATREARVVAFANPLTGGQSTCSIYLARR